MSATGSALQTPFSNPSRFSLARFSDRSLLVSTATDVITFLLLFVAGGLAIYFHKAGRDFVTEDVSYFERARSLLKAGVDGFNGRPETTQPPGLPVILAALCYLRACSYGAMLGLMAAFEALGFGISYVLLRREIGRVGAAVICLLLIASPLYFAMSTQQVGTALPFFFASMSALLAAKKLGESTTTPLRALWASMLAVLGIASLMIASAGIALLAAIVLKVICTYWGDRKLAAARLKEFAVVLLLAIAVQGLWMQRKPAPLEWPIPGYPRPYLQQLLVKDGHNPELGYATPKDVALRLTGNLRGEALLLEQLFSEHWINPGWWSIAIAGPVLAIFLGWATAIWETRGQSLEAWFFACYQAVYLLWPWNIEVRFFLPVAPLACLYLWKGLRAAVDLVRSRSGPAGIAYVLSSAALAMGCIKALQNEPRGVSIPKVAVQIKLSLLVWCLSGLAGAFLTWRDALRLPTDKLRRFEFLFSRRVLRGGALAAGIGIAGLLLNALSRDLEVKRDNLNLNSVVNQGMPDVEAAKWIQSHTSSGAVIMARHVPITYYYANRRIVWFAPSSNAELLMGGILKYKVDYILTVKRSTYYYLPPDDDSMAALLSRYPGKFRLVESAGKARIFQVTRHEGAQSNHSENPPN